MIHVRDRSVAKYLQHAPFDIADLWVFSCGSWGAIPVTSNRLPCLNCSYRLAWILIRGKRFLARDLRQDRLRPALTVRLFCRNDLARQWVTSRVQVDISLCCKTLCLSGRFGRV